ncbi:hypothetical protein M422DRAFT_178327, partial [Sphaerobolus stellatus SS14]
GEDGHEQRIGREREQTHTSWRRGGDGHEQRIGREREQTHLLEKGEDGHEQRIGREREQTHFLEKGEDGHEQRIGREKEQTCTDWRRERMPITDMELQENVFIPAHHKPWRTRRLVEHQCNEKQVELQPTEP